MSESTVRALIGNVPGVKANAAVKTCLPASFVTVE